MDNYTYSLLICAAFTFALTAFPDHAAIKGWRVGALFALPAPKVTIVSGLIGLGLVLHVLIEVVRGNLPWWWLLALPVAAFLGGFLVTSILGRSTGMVSLVMSPAAFVVGSYLFANQ